jgi:hypothetical protein
MGEFRENVRKKREGDENEKGKKGKCVRRAGRKERDRRGT